LIGPSLKRPG